MPPQRPWERTPALPPPRPRGLGAAAIRRLEGAFEYRIAQCYLVGESTDYACLWNGFAWTRHARKIGVYWCYPQNGAKPIEETVYGDWVDQQTACDVDPLYIPKGPLPYELRYENITRSSRAAPRGKARRRRAR
jgi:hypothetical protein